MGDTGEPPPGGGNSKPPGRPSPHEAMTSEWTEGGTQETPCRMRSYEEIVADERKNRNSIIVKLTKIVKFENGKEVKAKNLSMEEVGELFFDVMKVKVEDCIGLSLSTSRYDTKEIRLRPRIDPLIPHPVTHSRLQGS